MKKAGRRQPVFAALDLGTNNCRLLIAQPTGSGFRVIDGFSRIVRLGEGVSEAGALSDAAIQRTVDFAHFFFVYSIHFISFY